jgi:hypothetical protein
MVSGAGMLAQTNENKNRIALPFDDIKAACRSLEVIRNFPLLEASHSPEAEMNGIVSIPSNVAPSSMKQ